jgi:peptide/nickel transport system ATP-binding protein
MAVSAQLLAVRDLKVWYKVYGGYLKVLDGIDLDVARGEKVGIVGETGSGKTTMMKAIMRLLPGQARIPQGQVLFDGHDVLKMRRRDLRGYRAGGISMIFQDPTASLNPVFKIESQLGAAICSARTASGVPAGQRATRLSRAQIRTVSNAVLSSVALPDPDRILRSYPFQLSGGMRQRICIALALSTARTMLIADEPTTSLDVTIQAQILDLIRNLVEERRTSLILITHSLGVAREMTDRIYVIYAGTMIEVARTEKLYRDPLHPYTQGLLVSVPKLTGGGFANGIPGSIPSYLNPPKGCRFAPRCPRVLDECVRSKPPLFEIREGQKVACFLYGKRGYPEA